MDIGVGGRMVRIGWVSRERFMENLNGIFEYF